MASGTPLESAPAFRGGDARIGERGSLQVEGPVHASARALDPEGFEMFRATYPGAVESRL